MFGVTVSELLDVLVEAARGLWTDYADDRKITAGEVARLLAAAGSNLAEAADASVQPVLEALGNLLSELADVLDRGRLELNLGPADFIRLTPEVATWAWRSYSDDHKITPPELLTLFAGLAEGLAGEAEPQGAEALEALAAALRALEPVIQAGEAAA